MRHWMLSLGVILFMVGLSTAQTSKDVRNLDQALAGGGTLPKNAQPAMEERVSKMEALMQQQRQEIETLRKQLANQDETRLNKARADEIRKMIKEILADEKFRNEIYQPTLTAGYDHGFYIRSADDSFYLKTRARTQFRYIGVNRQEKDPNFFGNKPQHSLSGFEYERMRLYFNGWLWNKNLKYVLSLEGSTNNDDANVKLYDAYFDYEYVKNHKLQWGKFLLPYSRQGVNASTYQQQFVDYSMPAAYFGAGQSLGIMAHGDVLKNKLSYSAGVFNGTNNAGDDIEKNDSKMATAGRLVYHVLPGYDEADETDLLYHEKPAMDIGGSFLYNQNDGDLHGQSLGYSVADMIRGGRGGYGLSSDKGSDVVQLGADIGFKYKGFSITGEYYFRNVNSDHEWSAWNRLTAGGRGTSSPQGGYIQAGYFVIPKKLEFAGRLGGIWGLGDDQSMEEALGVNYYIHGQALKLSADVTHIEEAPITNKTTDINLNDDMWMYRIQIQATMD